LLLQGISVLHSDKLFSVRLLLQVLRFVAREVAAVMVKGVQVAIVVGGGNYFRGANAWDGLERATADNIG
jgi:uridylate kinase